MTQHLCDRCSTPWPSELLVTLEKKRLCCLCWRSVIYPYKTTKRYQQARVRAKYRDLEKAAEYALMAGVRATAVYTWERAITHYQTSLELLEELDADLLQQAEVLEKLALVIGLGRGTGATSNALSVRSSRPSMRRNPPMIAPRSGASCTRIWLMRSG